MLNNYNKQSDEFWNYIISETYSQYVSGGNEYSFKKILLNGQMAPDPQSTSFLQRHLGDLKGQKADWRASLVNKDEGFHAVEFDDFYSCHIDKIDPLKKPLQHLIKDSPKTLVAIGIVGIIGSLIAYYSLKK